MSISWQDFEAVELRVGTIVDVQEFPQARKPAYQLTIDFGEFGVKKSSALEGTLTKQTETDSGVAVVFV